MVIILVVLIGLGAFLYHQYRRPPLNVILLTVDTFRPDHMGCYGYQRDTSPFLDTVARKGVIFSTVISSAPWTSPGLISIFTGLYPPIHGVRARGDSLLVSTKTLFDIFKEHGFKVPNISYLTDIANFTNLGLDPNEPAYFKEASEQGEELLKWLDDHHRSRFMIWYHYRFLHLPFDPDDPHNIFITESGKEALESKGVKIVQKEAVVPRGTTSFTPEEKEVIVALYDGQLRQLDHFIKRLYQRMTRWKLHRNTLVVITADHGEELFDHGFIGHASTAIHVTLYDEVLKIPLVLYAPSHLPEGLVIEEQVRQVDIMPTILDMVDLPVPDPINGVSLRFRIKGKKGNSPFPALSESVLGGYQSTLEQKKITLRSIRSEGWKLICKEDGERGSCQLFDLREDPGEKKGLFEEEMEQGERLRKELFDSFAEMYAKRLTMMTKEKVIFSPDRLPKGAILERPFILSPKHKSVIQIREERGQMIVRWTGDKRLTYVIQYDVGKGWRNLKETIPVKGNDKLFGPLPREAWEPLPYWNPYRIRVSPYGMEKYWSDWVEFSIVATASH
jgi:arylsulfatase A-like enzyme